MQKRGSTLHSLGAEIERALKDRSLADGLLPHRARTLWADVAGEKIAGATTAETVRGGVLFVKVRSSAWANELTFYKAEMLRKLNMKVGAAVLTDIHFTVVSRSGANKPSRPEAQTNRQAVPIEIDTPAYGPTDSESAESAMDRVTRIRERAMRVDAAKRELGWIACSRCGALFEPGNAKPDAHQASGTSAAALCPLCSTLIRSSG